MKKKKKFYRHISNHKKLNFKHILNDFDFFFQYPFYLILLLNKFALNGMKQKIIFSP